MSEIDTESGDFKGKSFAAEEVREFLLRVRETCTVSNEGGKS